MKTNNNLNLKRLLAASLIICLSLFMFPANPSEAASSTKEAFKQEFRQMLYDVDTSTHDISKYRLSAYDLLDVYNELKADPTDKWMVAAYYSNLSYTYTTSRNVVKTFCLANVDSDVKGRYSRLMNNVKSIKAGIEPSMKDLDKIIYLHDAIDELVSYKFVAYQSYGAGGILGDKVGVCAGYTKAYNLLLEDQGIKANYIMGLTLDHGWTSVCLDGNWYHIDATWDDTTSPVSGQYYHNFLLRNDEEFAKAGKYTHGSWEIHPTKTNNPSTSTKYTNWYVHDIVGKMAFENGYWYYVDRNTNSIMENTAEGGKAKVILNGAGKGTITLIDATSEGITYKEAGTKKTVGYEGEAPVVEAEAPVEEAPVRKAAPMPAPAPAEEIDTTPAAFYIQLEGTTGYTNIGNGTIAKAVTSKDGKFIADNIVSTPEMSKWISSGKVIEYTAITKSGAGKYFVKGYVKDAPEAAVDTPAEQPAAKPVVEGTKATIYLTINGTLTNVGTGKITGTGSSSKDADIAKRLVETPDLSKYLGTDGYIVWQKLTTYDNGKTPTVRGTVCH